MIDPGLLRRERLRIPLWLTLTGLTLRLLLRVVVALVRVAARYWALTVLLLAAVLLWRRFGGHGLLAAVVVTVAVCAAVLVWWWLLRPASFVTHVSEPVRGI